MASFIFRKKGETPQFPLSDFSQWDDLKREYEDNGFNFMDFELSTSPRTARITDSSNLREFNKTKKLENKLCNRIRSINMATVKAPPNPTNEERLKQFKKWKTGRPAFDTSMATLNLYKEFKKEPCVDYPPEHAVEFYLKLKCEKFNKTHKFGKELNPYQPKDFKGEGDDIMEEKTHRRQRSRSEVFHNEEKEEKEENHMRRSQSISFGRRNMERMMGKPVTSTAPRQTPQWQQNPQIHFPMKRSNSCETLAPPYPYPSQSQIFMAPSPGNPNLVAGYPPIHY